MKSRSWTRPYPVPLVLLLSACLLTAAPAARADDMSEFRKAEKRTQAVAERLVAVTVGLGRGSGVMVSEDGMILTAAHVLAAAQPGEELAVVLSDGRQAKAKALGCDHTADAGLAQIIGGGKWPFAERGSSAGVKPGDWCLALGHPGGVRPDRKPPVRLGRVLTTGPGDRMDNGLITDATVGPGDSGGPLFDLDGKVIGINSSVEFGLVQNRHVPVDRFKDRWDAFVRGEQFGVPVVGPLAMPQKPGARTLWVGDKAPALAVDKWVRGDEVKGFEKGKVYVIEFWATRCAPCVAGMKDLTALQKKYKDKGVTVIGVTATGFGDTLEEVEKLLKVKGDDVGYSIAMDQSGKTAATYMTAAGFVAVPVVFVVDGAGRVAHIGVGKSESLDGVLKDVCAGTWDLAKAAAADKKREGGLQTGDKRTDEFLKLLQERIAAGDPEVFELAKAGKLELTPEKMAELTAKWGKKDGPAKNAGKPGALPAPGGAAAGGELVELLQKYAKPGPYGMTQLEVPSDKLDEVRALIKKQSLAHPDLKFGKSGPEVTRRLADIAALAGKGVVAVQCGGKTVSLGAVARKDGYVVTKASELSGPVTCEIGGRAYPAEVVGTVTAHDLALLRVQADDLTPVEWADDKEPPLGSWLVTPGTGGKALALGVFGQPGRKISTANAASVRRAVLGVSLDPAAKAATVNNVSPDGPAQKAGFLPGDVVTAVGDHATKDAEAVYKALDSYKVGDKVKFAVRRGTEAVSLTATLAAPESVAGIQAAGRVGGLDGYSHFTGRMSGRADGFPSAFGHDGVLEADECGGPVVGLDGRAVGLNIARADRTTTFAIPAKAVKSVVANLIAAAK